MKVVEQIRAITHGKKDTILSIYYHVKQVEGKLNVVHSILKISGLGELRRDSKKVSMLDGKFGLKN